MSGSPNRRILSATVGAIACLLLGSNTNQAIAAAVLEQSVLEPSKQADAQDIIEDLEVTDETIDDAEAVLENIETIEENIETIEESIEEALTEETRTEEDTLPSVPIRQTIQCPSEIEPLAELLIRDIPGYTNRVLQRTVAVLPWTEADVLRLQESEEIVREPYRPSRVLVAGKLNLEPLDLSEYAFTTSPTTGGEVTQLFFTTLSRQYVDLQADETQEYHWVFLTQTTDGWRLAFMFSAIDDLPIVQIPTPPRESSESSVGQAIQLWLRDCRAGAIEPPSSGEP
ncbi:hypothetical protein [cf. Phormidesmis sp. LEGE 11477]|uniref:hypothetical protein n=1 Tax=cf. Phormidesmis sp. LEGE 11477 TaxID=1828680 RepID=UPI00187EF7B7|nr:hypothetical protein [cf. Phormidesmis sp. LEGE 11477]MBE9059462.1 hypothetical protein [cf. Phormidesmis sp. LEGE 11477]